MAQFRENVRTHAKTLKATPILQECDRLRDEILPNVGVRLEDKEGNGNYVNVALFLIIDKISKFKKQIVQLKACTDLFAALIL